jgi:hypothetical protein
MWFQKEKVLVDAIGGGQLPPREVLHFAGKALARARFFGRLASHQTKKWTNVRIAARNKDDTDTHIRWDAELDELLGPSAPKYPQI